MVSEDDAWWGREILLSESRSDNISTLKEMQRGIYAMVPILISMLPSDMIMGGKAGRLSVRASRSCQAQGQMDKINALR